MPNTHKKQDCLIEEVAEKENATECFSKKHVSGAFRSGVKTYCKGNQVQKITAEHLFTLISKTNSKMEVTRCLDLGAGIGLNSEKLASFSSTVIAADLTFGALAQLNGRLKNEPSTQNVVPVNLDAERLPFSLESFELVYSNLMLQWCNNPDVVLEQVSQTLTKGGGAVISTLIEGSLCELQYAWSKVDNQKHVNDFISKRVLENIVSRLNMNCNIHCKVSYKTETIFEPSVIQICKGLKNIGANYVAGRKRKGLTGKSAWQQMSLMYEKFRTGENLLPLTYEVAYIEIIKKA